MSFMWWVEKFFHIETLFAIFVLWCLWFVFFYGDKQSDVSSRLNHLINTFENISSKSDYDHTTSFRFAKRKSTTTNKSSLSSTQHPSPIKRKYKSEERCREIFEGLFDQEFPSIRPSWLKNPTTGMNLELDGYCANIATPLGKGLAFEYDGQQHARYTPKFHESPKNFVSQCKRDIWKDKKCRELGILVIRIPHTIRFDELDMYIVKELGRYRLV